MVELSRIKGMWMVGTNSNQDNFRIVGTESKQESIGVGIYTKLENIDGRNRFESRVEILYIRYPAPRMNILYGILSAFHLKNKRIIILRKKIIS